MIQYAFENNQHIAYLSGVIKHRELNNLIQKLEIAMDIAPISFVEVLRFKMMTPLAIINDFQFFIKNKKRFKSITVVCDNPILMALSKRISRTLFPFEVRYLKEKEFHLNGAPVTISDN